MNLKKLFLGGVAAILLALSTIATTSTPTAPNDRLARGDRFL